VAVTPRRARATTAISPVTETANTETGKLFDGTLHPPSRHRQNAYASFLASIKIHQINYSQIKTVQPAGSKRETGAVVFGTNVSLPIVVHSTQLLTLAA
jgi:hypothetical protein